MAESQREIKQRFTKSRGESSVCRGKSRTSRVHGKLLGTSLKSQWGEDAPGGKLEARVINC